MPYFPIRRTLVLALFACVLTPNIQAQNKLNQPRLQEIGIDFAPWVQGKKGASVLLRTNLGKPGGQKWVKQNVFRGLFGFVQYQPTPEQWFWRWQSREEITTLRAQERYVFAHIGLERQLRRKWFQVHFGGDVGYSQGEKKIRITQVTTETNVPTFYGFYRGRINYWQAQIALFSGLSVDLGRHISIGSELKVSLDFRFSETDGEIALGSTNERQFFRLLSQQNGLRFLYLSYRF